MHSKLCWPSAHPLLLPWPQHYCLKERLPVPQCIQFKILLITHKPLCNQALSYLSDLLHFHTPAHRLCLADTNLLFVPRRTKHRTCGDISNTAPTLWNSFPKHIWDCTNLYTFKKRLKTELFRTDFNDWPDIPLLCILLLMYLLFLWVFMLFFCTASEYLKKCCPNKM